ETGEQQRRADRRLVVAGREVLALRKRARDLGREQWVALAELPCALRGVGADRDAGAVGHKPARRVAVQRREALHAGVPAADEIAADVVGGGGPWAQRLDQGAAPRRQGERE